MWGFFIWGQSKICFEMPSPFDVQTSLKYVFSFKSTKWKREIIFKIFVSNKIISRLYNTTKFIWWGPFQQNKKQYQSILDGLTQNVSTKLILAFSKFLKQKTFGVAIKLFSDSTIWCPYAGNTTANNNNIQKRGTLSLLYESFLRSDL